jgi:hypothetical protein
MAIFVPYNKNNGVAIFAGGLILVGIVLLILMVQSTIDRANGSHAVGTILSMQQEPTNLSQPNSGMSSFPVVQFQTASGTMVTFTSTVVESGSFVGQTVTVAYDPQLPDDAVINPSLSSESIAFSVPLVLFLIGGLAMWSSARKAKAEAENDAVTSGS